MLVLIPHETSGVHMVRLTAGTFSAVKYSEEIFVKNHSPELRETVNSERQHQLCSWAEECVQKYRHWSECWTKENHVSPGKIEKSY